jgi:hypothetical protein
MADNPGPGYYSPRDIGIPAPPRFSFHGPNSRDSWLAELEKTPSPADYSPITDYDKTVGVSLCGHERFTTRKPSIYVKTRGEHLVAIDQLIIDLSKIPDMEAAKRYLYTHPELRVLIQEMVDSVLDTKPKKPIDFLREKFEAEKDETAEQVAAREAAIRAANADKLIWL